MALWLGLFLLYPSSLANLCFNCRWKLQLWLGKQSCWAAAFFPEHTGLLRESQQCAFNAAWKTAGTWESMAGWGEMLLASVTSQGWDAQEKGWDLGVWWLSMSRGPQWEPKGVGLAQSDKQEDRETSLSSQLLLGGRLQESHFLVGARHM